jgi:hypothetical protein
MREKTLDSLAKKSTDALFSHLFLLSDCLYFITISFLNVVINKSKIGELDAVFHVKSTCIGFTFSIDEAVSKNRKMYKFLMSKPFFSKKRIMQNYQKRSLFSAKNFQKIFQTYIFLLISLSSI